MAVPNCAELEVLVRSCGKYMRCQHDRRGKATLRVEQKSDDTPVTEVDIAINDYVITWFRSRYSHIRVQGEEACAGPEDARIVCLLDPLDGTKSFIDPNGNEWSIALSILEDGVPVRALIMDPLRRRVWVASKGVVARCNQKRLWLPDMEQYKGKPRVIVATWLNCPFQLERVKQELVEKCDVHDPFGIAMYGGVLASGEVDAVLFPGSIAHESAAMALIVEEAGGVTSDIFGEPLRFTKNENGIYVTRGCILARNAGMRDVLASVVREMQV